MRPWRGAEMASKTSRSHWISYKSCAGGDVAVGFKSKSGLFVQLQSLRVMYSLNNRDVNICTQTKFQLRSVPALRF